MAVAVAEAEFDLSFWRLPARTVGNNVKSQDSQSVV